MEIDEPATGIITDKLTIVAMMGFEKRLVSHSLRSRRGKEVTHIRRNARIRDRVAKKELDAPIKINHGGKQHEIKSPAEAMEFLKENTKTVESIQSVQALVANEKTRRKFKGVINGFVNGRRRKHEKRTQIDRLRKFWSLLGAQEHYWAKEAARKDDPCVEAQDVMHEDGWCEGCKKHHVFNSVGERLRHCTECPKIADELKPTTCILFHGKAGKCTNSPFGGHDRWTGKKSGKMIALHMLDILTPEDFSSTRDPYCGHRVEEAKRSVVKNGKIVKCNVHGALECQNPNCIAFKAHHTIQKRDELSSMFIGVVY
jgi:hypothetical protein